VGGEGGRCFLTRQGDVILDLDVTVLISDNWGDFVNLYTVTNGRQV
jgi:hypothetical protein